MVITESWIKLVSKQHGCPRPIFKVFTYIHYLDIDEIHMDRRN